jgi:hypothetical protein
VGMSALTTGHQRGERSGAPEHPERRQEPAPADGLLQIAGTHKLFRTTGLRHGG